jgi:hypothetical protein
MEKLNVKQMVALLNTHEITLLIYALRPTAFQYDTPIIQEAMRKLQKKFAEMVV